MREQLQPRDFEQGQKTRRPSCSETMSCSGQTHGPIADVPHERVASFVAAVFACVEWNGANGLPKARQKLALQYVELEEEALRIDPDNSQTWRIMPKLHLLQRLCDLGFQPKDTWAYKDGARGGTLAKLFTRRGGKRNQGHNCFEILDGCCHTIHFPAAFVHRKSCL